MKDWLRHGKSTLVKEVSANEDIATAWGNREYDARRAEGMSTADAFAWVTREALGFALLISGFEVLRRVALGEEPVWDIKDAKK